MEAIIFDLDNTLVERQDTLVSFLSQLYNEHVFESISQQEHIHFVIKEDQFGYRNKTELFNEIVENVPWKTNMDLHHFTKYWYNHFPKNAKPMNGLYETLEKLKQQNKKLGLITNGKVKTQENKLKQLNIQEYFDTIVISEAVGVKKPHSSIFEFANRNLHVQSEKSVFVGDHPRNDIAGAKKIGMKTIWKRSYIPWDETLVLKPDHTVNHLPEIIDWLMVVTTH